MKENEKQTTEIVSEENEKSEKKKIVRQPWWPDWFTGRTINEPIFCREFLTKYRLAYTENSFFSVEGKVTDENALRAVIYKMVERFVVTGVSKKVDDIVKALRITAQVKELLPQTVLPQKPVITIKAYPRDTLVVVSQLHRTGTIPRNRQVFARVALEFVEKRPRAFA